MLWVSQLMVKVQLKQKKQDLLRKKLKELWLEKVFMSHFKQVLNQLMLLFQSVEVKESLLLEIDKQEKQQSLLIL
eukprot:TRINITY_DN2597_c0_g1_i1.p2 TRINITY_DN2597_c0_g1~~TRINITY_DN2597_c0_g1_i1.p2  ORF type:complete len:75 (-),score=4.13 TRINITY_DN2597_c0_g1_i1:65-289(-)